jgi:hypothetical protein
MSDLKTSPYETKDIYVAAYLIELGYTKYTLIKNDKQFFFVFDNNEDQHLIENCVDRYWDDDIKVSPKKLFTCFRELKFRMYNREERA